MLQSDPEGLINNVNGLLICLIPNALVICDVHSQTPCDDQSALLNNTLTLAKMCAHPHGKLSGGVCMGQYDCPTQHANRHQKCPSTTHIPILKKL